MRRVSTVIKIVLTFYVFVQTGFLAVAQKSLIYTEPDLHYKKGLELFDKEKYGAAEHEFRKAYENNSNYPLQTRINSEYYIAVCAMELYHPEAEFLLSRFAEKHPDHPKIQKVYFRLGKLYFRQKNYKKSIEFLEKTDPFFLTSAELPEYYFKTGYGYFHAGNYEKANKAFYEIKDVDTKYTEAANYYYAHIAYVNKNYETALKSFQKLKDSEVFGRLVPYYIVQIYYLQQKFDELLTYATPILDSLKPQNEAEINHILGDALFKKGKYRESINYLEEFQKTSSNVNKSDYYQLGFAYYKNKEYNRAVNYFEKVSDGNDSLAQNALYHLADAYLKTGKKTGARSAFQSASKLNFDKKIKEDALFNYAKLSMELSNQPQAIFAFQDYLRQYPNTVHYDEINELLAQAFLTTKNYKDALEALEKIKNKSQRVKIAYQKVSYYRGVELFNNGDLKGSISLFTQSLENLYDRELEPLALYWRAEAEYKLNQFEEAAKGYKDFLFHPKAINLNFYNNANYNTGYCYFKLEDYKEATNWFRKYLKSKEETDFSHTNDAYLRIADSYFIQKEYSNALEYYNLAITNKAPSSDYALFQKAVISGLSGKFEQKIAALTDLLSKYKKSKYLADANYETADAYFLLGNNNKALEYYQKIINDFPNSIYVKKAWLGTGLAHYNNKQDEKALEAYKKVLTAYPGSPEAKEALVGIKNISVSSGNVNEYMNVIKDVPYVNIGQSSRDSVTYEAAETRYLKGDCENAARDFQSYLEKFPEGIFALNAHFYKAECETKSKNFDRALESYSYVISKPKNKFTEKALQTAAGLYYRQKQYEKAAETYSQLEKTAEKSVLITEALSGELKSYIKLKKAEEAAAAAEKVLRADKVPNEVLNEAHFALGKAALEKDSLFTAQKEFAIVYKNLKNEMAAEAKYNISWIQFRQKKFAECQKSLYEIINQIPSYDFWVGKSFILLADTYSEQGDLFQAKQTLQSIIENYETNPSDPEDLVAIAKAKAEKINKIEEDKKQEEKRAKMLKEEQQRKLFEEQTKIIEQPTDTTGFNPIFNK